MPMPNIADLVLREMSAQAQEQRTALIARVQRSTWAQRLVACLLVVVCCVYAVLLHLIEMATLTEERSDSASPRTPWSSRRRRQISRWHEYQQQLARVCSQYQPASPYDDRSRLVLLGDSITEAWGGTSYGEPVERAAGAPLVLQQTLAQRWMDPFVLGISGDQTQHLLWRLSHGELSGPMAADPRLLVVLLIGTNNLGAGHAPEDVARGVLAVANAVLNRTRGRVLVNALLPRGDGAHTLARLCPPRCNADGQPYESFTPAIHEVNSLVAAAIGRLARSSSLRARFVDCGSSFIAPEGTESEVVKELMPDRLHPNARGHRIWARCLTDDIIAAGWERNTLATTGTTVLAASHQSRHTSLSRRISE